MGQNYWIKRESIDKYEFFVVEYIDRNNEVCVRQSGQGPYLTRKGAEKALQTVNRQTGVRNAKIIQFVGSWQDAQ